MPSGVLGVHTTPILAFMLYFLSENSMLLTQDLLTFIFSLGSKII